MDYETYYFFRKKVYESLNQYEDAKQFANDKDFELTRYALLNYLIDSFPKHSEKYHRERDEK